MNQFTVAEAAAIVGLPESHIRGWVQRAAFDWHQPFRKRKVRFDLRGLRCLALTKDLVEHGVSSNVAAVWAATIVDRAKEWPLVAVFSRDPNVSPMLIPEDTIASTDAVIVISLAPIWSRIADGAKALGR